MDYHETWWKDVVGLREEPIKFGCRSGSGGGSRIFFSHCEMQDFSQFLKKHCKDIFPKNLACANIYVQGKYGLDLD